MNDDFSWDDMRRFRKWVIGLAIGIVLLGAAATMVSRAFDLAWFPWQIKMQTGMIRSSNSYVTTQQSALRQLRLGYDDAPESGGQRAGIVRQMREIADTIPDNVQPDIRSFIAAH